jgi:hypothetical protein
MQVRHGHRIGNFRFGSLQALFDECAVVRHARRIDRNAIRED